MITINCRYDSINDEYTVIVKYPDKQVTEMFDSPQAVAEYVNEISLEYKVAYDTDPTPDCPKLL